MFVTLLMAMTTSWMNRNGGLPNNFSLHLGFEMWLSMTVFVSVMSLLHPSIKAFKSFLFIWSPTSVLFLISTGSFAPFSLDSDSGISLWSSVGCGIWCPLAPKVLISVAFASSLSVFPLAFLSVSSLLLEPLIVWGSFPISPPVIQWAIAASWSNVVSTAILPNRVRSILVFKGSRPATILDGRTSTSEPWHIDTRWTNLFKKTTLESLSLSFAESNSSFVKYRLGKPVDFLVAVMISCTNLKHTKCITIGWVQRLHNYSIQYDTRTWLTETVAWPKASKSTLV